MRASAPRGFRKVLVANRGEIAVRIIRACREMGISPVAVYSEADRDSLAVRLADEAYLIGPPPARDSYLRIDALIRAARESRVEAIHPGYGFLSENAEFAMACEASGVVFIGPPASALTAMGNKVEARRIMRQAGVAVIAGSEALPRDESEAEGIAAGIGFPIMIKASAGGGGKGMRIVRAPAELSAALRAARSEAGAYFGDDSIYMERYVERPRHIEVQVLADGDGNVIHLGERECSIQRRHQKIVEESPSPIVDAATRERLGETAVRAARAVGYVSAGTVEMLRAEDGSFSFMEMNTRLQVEHPVTELITGIDIVKAQIEIAAGARLPCAQEDLTFSGHAIEGRIYAEDPDRQFMPSPGRIGSLRAPSGPFVRDDSAAYAGYDVPIHYDPMISKLVVWGRSRHEAIDRMRRALDEYRIDGIRTTIPFLRRLVRHHAFIAGDIDTHFIEQHGDELTAAAGSGRSRSEPGLTVEEIAMIAIAVSAARKGSGPERSPLTSSPAKGTREAVRSKWKLAARLGAAGRAP